MFPDFKTAIPVDQAGIDERVARLASRSVKKESKISALKTALSMIDLTTLEGKDTVDKIEQLCRKAIQPCASMPDLPPVAAVCVYPTHVNRAKKLLQHSSIKVASVASGFPAGNVSRKVKLEDVRFAVSEGADEIDMVISRGEFLRGNYEFVFEEIAAIKDLCGSARLKVILETGELGSLDQVRRASDIAIAAGADFIKTSTGKIQPAATPAVTLVMLEAIYDHFRKTGKMVGMKPAGGISTSKTAIQYLVILYETLGSAWMNNSLFRFGASSLANDIILQLLKEKTGTYHSSNYISVD